MSAPTLYAAETLSIGGVYFRPGQEVPHDVCLQMDRQRKGAVDRLVARGSLVERQPTPTAPLAAGPSTETSTTPVDASVPGVHKWARDPATLRGKTLDELNIMLVETDPSMKPCDTIEEAVGLLTMDFGKP